MPKKFRSKAGRYYPLWATLKEAGSVRIVAPVHLHARICKAVINEKYVDVDFKQQEGWRMKYLRYTCNAETGEILFSLVYKTTDIISKDL